MSNPRLAAMYRIAAKPVDPIGGGPVHKNNPLLSARGVFSWTPSALDTQGLQYTMLGGEATLHSYPDPELVRPSHLITAHIPKRSRPAPPRENQPNSSTL